MLPTLLRIASIDCLRLFAIVGALTGAAHAAIFYNQVAYYPNQTKYFVTTETEAVDFEIIDLDSSKSIFRARLQPPRAYPDADLWVRQGDFSSVQKPGHYRIVLTDSSETTVCTIGPRKRAAAFSDSLKSFYFHRASTAIDSVHGGIYARPYGHPDDQVRFHPSTGKSGNSAPFPKGWYDAGDYGKYIVNGGYALGTLLSLHELHPNGVTDTTTIPESGNGLSDLLDTCRWEIEWFLTMQDSDGGVFHKLSTLSFAGLIMPQDARNAQRFVIGKSTAATLNFAAPLAQAARLYKATDPDFSAQCLAAAEAAWLWALAHPTEYFTNPPDVATGNYGQNDVTDEFIWAGAQLFLTTGAKQYLNYLERALKDPQVDFSAGWADTRNLAWYSLLTVASALDADTCDRIRTRTLERANEIIHNITANPIRAPLNSWDFGWGSNGTAAARGVLLAYAHALTKDPSYLDAMAETADYLLGRNATGYSFLTGHGINTPQQIHHRLSAADGVAAPIPGLLVGGPNHGRHDKLIYPSDSPALAYIDTVASYAANEVAINWNAPLVFLLATLHHTYESDHPQRTQPVKSPAN